MKLQTGSNCGGNKWNYLWIWWFVLSLLP